MLVRYWLKSVVPSGETWSVTWVQLPFCVQIVVHRLGDGVTVGIVRRHEGGLLAFAVGLQQHRADRVRGGLAVEILAEAVADTVLAGGVVRARDAGDVEDLLAVGEVVERDRDRARGRAGHQDDLVLVDEGLLLLHRVVRLGAAVGDHQVHRLAEQALGDLRRDLLKQRVAVVDVFDRKLIALELVFALHRVRSGARHGGADVDGRARRTVRPSAERRLILCERRRDKLHHLRAAERKGAETRSGRGGLSQQAAARESA